MYSIPGARKYDLSLRADDDLKEMDLVRRAANFSYMDDEAYVFMDAEDYTQYLLGPELVDQRHNRLGDPVLEQELVRDREDDVHNGISDPCDIETVRHHRPQ